VTPAKRAPTEAAAPAGHVAGRRAPARRSVPVGLESETPTRDPRRGHVTGRHAPAGRSAMVGPESEVPTRDPCRAQGPGQKVT